MVSTKTGIRPEEVRFRGQHVLFVEGNEESIDSKVLNELFEDGIRIEPLGPSSSIRSVARALSRYHPTYYFLIDRDHHKDDFVERCWNNFPDPMTPNLLVWRRREIENYFLDPTYLLQSRFCQASQDELEEKILEYVKERLFLDAANHVVISIRENLKRDWIVKFLNPMDFSTKEKALQKLRDAEEFGQHRSDVDQKVSAAEVERRFHERVELMTGGQSPLIFGTGEWLYMVQGKRVLAQVINSGCFSVPGADGTALEGREKTNEIVKNLLKEASVHPDDFVTLRRLIATRMNGEN